MLLYLVRAVLFKGSERRNYPSQSRAMFFKFWTTGLLLCNTDREHFRADYPHSLRGALSHTVMFTFTHLYVDFALRLSFDLFPSPLTHCYLISPFPFYICPCPFRLISTFAQTTVNNLSVTDSNLIWGLCHFNERQTCGWQGRVDVDREECKDKQLMEKRWKSHINTWVNSESESVTERWREVELNIDLWVETSCKNESRFAMTEGRQKEVKREKIESINTRLTSSVFRPFNPVLINYGIDFLWSLTCSFNTWNHFNLGNLRVAPH